MIDRFGKCPHCNRDWNGKDILQEVSKLTIFSHLNEAALMGIASKYGYTHENKLQFSSVSTYTRKDGTYYQCPSIRCGHIFNVETEEEYASLWHLKQGIKYEEEKEEQ